MTLKLGSSGGGLPKASSGFMARGRLFLRRLIHMTAAFVARRGYFFTQVSPPSELVHVSPVAVVRAICDADKTSM